MIADGTSHQLQSTLTQEISRNAALRTTEDACTTGVFCPYLFESHCVYATPPSVSLATHLPVTSCPDPNREPRISKSFFAQPMNAAELEFRICMCPLRVQLTVYQITSKIVPPQIQLCYTSLSVDGYAVPLAYWFACVPANPASPSESFGCRE